MKYKNKHVLIRKFNTTSNRKKLHERKEKKLLMGLATVEPKAILGPSGGRTQLRPAGPT